MKPLVIDLFTGLHGWLEAFLAEGYECVGYDIEDMCASLGKPRPEGIEFRQRDVRSIHGSEFADAAVIVASPPCQAYSYRAMPWSRAKALPPPDNTLFNECFRIQREASAAAGRHIPLIVENVRGAQKWVGRAQWHYGSFYLWGDVPALMPMTLRAQKANPDGTGRKHDSSGWTEKGSLKSHNRLVSNQPQEGYKTSGMNWSNRELRGQDFTRIASAQADGLKLKDQDGYERDHPNAFGWKKPRTSSKSSAGKRASAMIAKIPLPLSQHIARTFKPVTA